MKIKRYNVKLLERKNPLTHYLTFKIYFAETNAAFSINKLESILNIVIEKLKNKKFDSILHLNYFPQLHIENIESQHLYYSRKYNIIKLSKQRLEHQDKYFLARSIIHEIGHFVYYILLTENQRKLWNNYFNSTLKKVKIDTILKIIKKYSENEIKTKYPLLYYNIAAIETHKSVFDIDVFNYEQLLKWKSLARRGREYTVFRKNQ